MTRDEFNARLRREGGLRVTLRMLREDEGGRATPLSGESEYRVNWSIGRSDPDRQIGAPMLIDAELLLPGGETSASLIRLFPEAWPPDVPIGTNLMAFEGGRPVAEAVVTDVIAGERPVAP
jgi:hypothetical protein